MILRQEPKDIETFYIADKTKSEILYGNKFFPMYMWQGKFYYKKTKELIEFLRKGGEEN